MRSLKVVLKSLEAWEKRDWDTEANLLADDFTFTSQYDDHIDKHEFKTKCWDVVRDIGKYEVVSIIEGGEEVFVRYKNQINGTLVQNTEHVRVSNDKIYEVTVFFGRP